jgi:hypothetical protein
VNFWKRQLPAVVVFVVGMLMVIQFYIPHPASSASSKALTSGCESSATSR